MTTRSQKHQYSIIKDGYNSKYNNKSVTLFGSKLKWQKIELRNAWSVSLPTGSP